MSCTGVFTATRSGDAMGTESLIRPVKWDGAWHALPRPAPWTPSDSITGGFTSFSDFTGGNPVPLAITLASMSAAQSRPTRSRSPGTRSARSARGLQPVPLPVSSAGPGVKLNSTSCSRRKGWGGPEGFHYTYLDSAVLAPNTTYYYWLEDVNQDGFATRHEPVSVVYNSPTAVSSGRGLPRWQGPHSPRRCRWPARDSPRSAVWNWRGGGDSFA